MNGATMTLSDLRNDHAALTAMFRELELKIGSDTPPPPVELFELRRRFSSLLIGHLKSADWLLYPRLLASEDPEIAATARRLVEEMGGLAQTYNVFTERWDALAIEAGWPRYQAECNAMIKALTQRVLCEKKILYPLLERVERAA